MVCRSRAPRKSNLRIGSPLAGLASVQFFATETHTELARFAQAFAAGRAKPSEFAQEWKAALAGAQGIRVNEIFCRPPQ